MVLRITLIVVIAVIAVATNPAISLGTYCGPGGCPPLKVQVGGPGMYPGGPAMAGPRPMAGMPGCMPACPPPCPPTKCAPPCPPPACPPPTCQPPCESGFNPLAAIFKCLTFPFRLFAGGCGQDQSCAPPPCPPPCFAPMGPSCPPPIAKCKPPRGYAPAPMNAMRPMGY